MSKIRLMRYGIRSGTAASVAASAGTAAEIDWKKVDDGARQDRQPCPGDVHRYGFPRTDLQVTLDGVAIRPALGARRLGRVRADGRTWRW